MNDNRSRSEPEHTSVRLENDSNLDNDCRHPNETGPSTQEQTKASSQPSQHASDSNVFSKLQT